MFSGSVVKSGLLIIVALLVALPVIGCAPGETVPLSEEKVVRVGMLTDLTGPYSSIGGYTTNTCRDYYNYLNDEQGGIDGTKIEMIWSDHRNDLALAVTSYKRMKEQGVVVWTTVGTGDTTVTRAFVEADKIPVISWPVGCNVILPPSYVFCTMISNLQTLTGGSDWFQDEWEKKGLGRPMRMATLGWDIPYGRESLEPMGRWAEKCGAELVAALWVPSTAVDYTVELLAIKDAKPDLILGACHGGSLCRDAERVGLPQDVPIFCAAGSMGEPGYVDLAGAEVVRARMFSPLWTSADNKPVVSLIEELASQRGVELRWVSEGQVFGWNNSVVVAEAIRKAIAEVGYENLNGEAVKEAAETITGLDTGCGPPVSFTDYPNDRHGLGSFRVWRFDVAGDQWEATTGFIEAMSFPDAMREYVE